MEGEIQTRGATATPLRFTLHNHTSDTIEHLVLRPPESMKVDGVKEVRSQMKDLILLELLEDFLLQLELQPVREIGASRASS